MPQDGSEYYESGIAAKAQVEENQVLNGIFKTSGNQSGAGANRVVFPKNDSEIPHKIVFRAYKFKKLTRQDQTRRDAVTEIVLPLSAKLETSYKANYAGTDAGPIVGNIVSAMDAMQSDLGIKAALGKFTSQPGETVAKVGGVAAAAVGSTLLQSETVATIAGAAGVARNPFKILLYQGTDFRTHNFSWQLTPRNYEESKLIREIIYLFKYHMSPSYGNNVKRLLQENKEALTTAAAAAIGFSAGAFAGPVSAVSLGALALGASATESSETVENIKKSVAQGISDFAPYVATESRAFFDYPEVWRITLLVNDSQNPNLHKIGESVLESFNVDYHPQNYPAYVRSLRDGYTAAPASVTISLSFQETQIVTKESITGAPDFQLVG